MKHGSLHLRHPLLAAATVWLVLALAACSGPSEAELLASARALLDKKDPGGAVIQIKSAIQKNPESAAARLALGKTLLSMGEPVAALVELRKAQELQAPTEQVVPEMARAMLLLGEETKVISQYEDTPLADSLAKADLLTSIATAHAVRGDTAKADKTAQDALLVQPGFAPATVLQARLKAAAGDVDGALVLLNSVLAKDPAHEPAGVLRGNILWHSKKDATAALSTFTQVLGANPRNVSAHTAIIGILAEQKKPEQARAQFELLRKALPNHPDTLFLQAQFAFASKDFKSTREITDRLLKAAPEHPRVLELAGAAQVQLKGYTEAEAMLARALKNAPRMLSARHLLAQTYLRTYQPGKALDLLQPVLEGKQPDGASLALAGEAWMQLGEVKKADAAFALGAQVAPNDTGLRTSAALAQMSRGNTAVAAEQLQALAAEDAGPRADLALISARLRQNDAAGALKAIDGLARKTPDRPLADNLRGRLLLSQGDIPAATQAFEAAFKKDPNYFPAVASLAAIDMGAGKPEAARLRFEQLLKAQPDNHQALMALAELNARAGGTPEDTSALLRRAVKAQAGEPAPHLALINQLLAFDAKAAITAAREAAAALPNNPDIQSALGRAQLADNSAAQAVATFRQLVSVQPRNPGVHLQLADALVAAKDLAGAKAALMKALELKPDLAAAKRGLVLLALKDQRPQDAMKFAREIQQQSPKDPLGLSLEGDIEASRKNWDAAIAAYRSAHALGKSTDSAQRLHMAMRAANKMAEADQLAAAWTRDRPKDLAFRFYLGDAALTKGDFALAESHYQVVAGTQPKNALALNNVAWLMLKQGKPAAPALALAQQANDIQPGRPQLMDTLALALAAANQLPQAVELQKKAIARSPNDPALRLTLARLLIQSGDKPYARAELEDLVKLGDKFRDQAEVAALLKSL